MNTTKQTLRQRRSHHIIVMSVACFTRFIFMVFIAMVSGDLFDSFTAKGINLHQCKRKFEDRRPAEQNLFTSSNLICDRSCKMLTFLCAIQIMFVTSRYCCSCQLKLSGSIYQPNPDFSLSNLRYRPVQVPMTDIFLFSC